MITQITAEFDHKNSAENGISYLTTKTWHKKFLDKMKKWQHAGIKIDSQFSAIK